ncbi:MAG: phosphoenolpyruvate--protein phosphotransferase [Treponema sp.]|nr:phosphoenolpyruvate--protein phosphotransferase [Treponema sp.]
MSVSPGIALGTVFFVADRESPACTEKVADTAGELQQLMHALDVAGEELDSLYRKAQDSADNSVADIFMIHGMMLQDEDFRARMTELIEKENYSSVSAVSKAAEEFSSDLAESGSDYIAERGADVSDVVNRVIRILQGTNAMSLPDAEEKVILVANEITPSLTLMFDRKQLLGLVSAKGSNTSHAAILARSLGIPAVITSGIAYDNSINGSKCIVDGLKGTVTIAPDKEAEAAAVAGQQRYERELNDLELLKNEKAITKNGKEIKLFCNVGSLEDVDAAVSCGCDGVGLFRSEFLYLGRNSLPSEEELADVYIRAAEKLSGKKLVIRTLDIGADKKTDCIPMKDEENPALGIRALRLCFERPDLFEVQVRAILRAAVKGNVAVMFPMINSVSEVRRAKAFVTAAADDLEKRNIPHADRIETGIMVETPAAAVISDLLAAEVDFFSLGTNDLTQYTLAVDRQNEEACAYCDSHHEAVLRLIELTCRNAHNHNIWCGICGELGADEVLTERFVKAGIDELSVSPNSLLSLKRKIRSLE